MLKSGLKIGCVLVLLSFFACKGAKKIYLPDEEQIEVAPKEKFALFLEGNLATGFIWELKDSLNPTQIELIEVEDVTTTLENENNERTGEIWTFKLLDTVNVQLNFVYLQPFDRDNKTYQKQQSITIKSKSK